MEIKSVSPGAAIPGAIVRVELEGVENPLDLRVEVGEARAELVGVSNRALTVRIPEGAGDGLRVRGKEEARADLKMGRVLADELHAVANPAVDERGNVYTTFSGARGEKVPFSVFVIRPDGSSEPFLADITNPTGIVVGPDQKIYVTSRHTGAAYRSTMDKQVEKYAEGLGLATGLAFDSQGCLMVGDRGGYIRKVTPDLEVSVHCELEPSVSAYHLAIDADDVLYVAGPTLSTQDSIYRVTPDGQVGVLFRGFGRPQGLAFDRDGNLQVAASYRGRKGVFTLCDGAPELTVGGPMLVGLAYSRDKSRLYLADNSHLFVLPLD